LEESHRLDHFKNDCVEQSIEYSRHASVHTTINKQKTIKPNE
jgi:hypothetical protein